MRRMILALAIVMAMPAVASAGGGGHAAGGCQGFASGTAISMLDSCFNGTAQFVPAGGTLTVSNDGSLPHTLTAVDGSFDTGQLEAGETAELVIAEPGIYEVFCSLHGTADGQGMAGVLVVGEPVPGAASAGFDVEAVREAVAAENQALVEAVDGQTAAIESLVEDSQPAISPWVWIALLAGLALGIAAAAMFVATRSPGPDEEIEADQNRVRSAAA